MTVFEDVYRVYGHLLFAPNLTPLRIAGVLSRRGNGASVLARAIQPLSAFPALPPPETP